MSQHKNQVKPIDFVEVHIDVMSVYMIEICRTPPHDISKWSKQDFRHVPMKQNITQRMFLQKDKRLEHVKRQKVSIERGTFNAFPAPVGSIFTKYLQPIYCTLTKQKNKDKT